MDAEWAERARRAARLQLGVWIVSGVGVFCPIAWFLLQNDLRRYFSDQWSGDLQSYWIFLLSLLFAGLISFAIAFTSGFWVSLRLQRWVDGTREDRNRRQREALATAISGQRQPGASSSPSHRRP